MAYISTQYDPAWAAFKAAHPGPQQSAEYKSEEQKSQDLLNQIYSSPLGQRQYLGGGQFNQMFPELQKYGQQVSDWEKATAQLFQQQYGHSPILGTTISGPHMSGGTPSTTQQPSQLTIAQGSPTGMTDPKSSSLPPAIQNLLNPQNQPQQPPMPWEQQDPYGMNNSVFGQNSPYNNQNTFWQNTSFAQQ